MQALAYLNQFVVSLVLVLIAVACPASADEVWLLNGDTFTGTAQMLENGVLIFRTPFTDTIRVPWRQVAGIETAREVRVTVRHGGWRLARIIPGHEGSLRLLTTFGVSVDVRLDDVVAIVRPQSGVIVTGRAETGLLIATGSSDISSLHLAGQIGWRTLERQTAVDININRARTAGIQTARNLTSSVRYQEFLTDHIYSNANLILTSDEFRDLTLRVAPGVGIGYRAVRYGVASFSVDGGAGYVNEKHFVEADRSYFAARETLKFDFYLIPQRLQLYHQQDGYAGLTGGENQFIQTRSGVRLTLFGGFLMSAELGVNYDRRPPLGQDPVDRTFAITLGYQLGY